MFRIFKRDKPKKKGFSWLDYTIFALILIFILYYLIQYGFESSDTRSVLADLKIFLSYFRQFKIGWIEISLIIVISTYLIYLRYKEIKQKKEDDQT